MDTPFFDRARHVKYFTTCLRHLPGAYDRSDTNRLTLLHFAVHSLDLLNALPLNTTTINQCLTEEQISEKMESMEIGTIQKESMIDWIYSLQLTSGGFVGGTFLGPEEHNHTHSHIAMTYTALCTLAALGDNLQRVNKVKTVESLKALQRPDGSFQCISVGSEHDLRFLYCACVISYLLNDWSGVDKDRAVDYVRSCIAYDGGIALLPGQEGHGGSTFCAVASLTLMDRTDVLDRDLLIHWCVHRQVAGMQGRPNKAEDTCYSYWIGATLILLGKAQLLHHDQLREFVLKCQTPMGGFGKVIGSYPDVLHAFYGMSWLSLSSGFVINGDDKIDLKKMNCTIGICQDRMNVFDCTHGVP